MNIRTKTADYLVKVPFVRDAVINNADLSVFKEKPSVRIFIRNMIGMILIVFSYLIGWPLIFILGIISIYTKEPLIVIIGGPIAYGISHAVFWAGMFITGAHYTMIFLRWAARAAVIKLLGKDKITAAIEKSALPENVKN